MDEILREEMDYLSLEENKRDSITAEDEVRGSIGKSPTVDDLLCFRTIKS